MDIVFKISMWFLEILFVIIGICVLLSTILFFLAVFFEKIDFFLNVLSKKSHLTEKLYIFLRSQKKHIRVSLSISILFFIGSIGILTIS